MQRMRIISGNIWAVSIIPYLSRPKLRNKEGGPSSLEGLVRIMYIRTVLEGTCVAQNFLRSEIIYVFHVLHTYVYTLP